VPDKNKKPPVLRRVAEYISQNLLIYVPQNSQPVFYLGWLIKYKSCQQEQTLMTASEENIYGSRESASRKYKKPADRIGCQFRNYLLLQ